MTHYFDVISCGLKQWHAQSTVPKKNGDWYIYPQFLAHENHRIAHKNAQKSFINFKPRIAGS